MRCLSHTSLVIFFIIAVLCLEVEASSKEKSKQHHKKNAKAAKSKHALLEEKKVEKLKVEKAESSSSEAAMVVDKAAVAPMIVGGGMPAPIELNSKVVDNGDFIETKEEKAAMIAELKKQPKLVAMIDEEGTRNTPLFSSFPTPTPANDGKTSKPTVVEDCDPKSPPCKEWKGEICILYHKCGVSHLLPEPTNDDDVSNPDGSPTHMPLPNPTPSPSQPPTSQPSSSAPTYKGYTPMPTMSLQPTVAETSGPTQGELCDPQNPPCDQFFFGLCLGKRHCFGSHEPTPMPTTVPELNADKAKELKETAELDVMSGPTRKPTMGPTDFAFELDEKIYAEGQKEKRDGEIENAKKKAAKSNSQKSSALRSQAATGPVEEIDYSSKKVSVKKAKK